MYVIHSFDIYFMTHLKHVNMKSLDKYEKSMARSSAGVAVSITSSSSRARGNEAAFVHISFTVK